MCRRFLRDSATKLEAALRDPADGIWDLPTGALDLRREQLSAAVEAHVRARAAAHLFTAGTLLRIGDAAPRCSNEEYLLGIMGLSQEIQVAATVAAAAAAAAANPIVMRVAAAAASCCCGGSGPLLRRRCIRSAAARKKGREGVENLGRSGRGRRGRRGGGGGEEGLAGAYSCCVKGPLL